MEGEDARFLNNLHQPLWNKGGKSSGITEAKWKFLDKKTSTAI